MKIALVLLCALFGTALAQSTVGPIDWMQVTPIWQAPAFLQNFPILRWIITRNPDRTNGFILGGEIAEDFQFPWNVGLLFHLDDMNGFCGGTLVTPEWVLTAAHCAQLATSGIAIAGGNNIMDANNLNQQRVTFSRREINPLWDASTFANDVALVRLDTPFTLSEHIQVARFPSVRYWSSTYNGQQATVAGWGSVAPWVVPNMRFIRNHIMTRLSCLRAFPTLVGPASVCTSGVGPSPCQGDSGVGLSVLEVDTEKTVIGVLSFGSALGCASSRPAVYTLVGPYMSWITLITGMGIREA